jgi:hypothetical protein
MYAKSLIIGVVIGGAVFGGSGYFIATQQSSSQNSRQFAGGQGVGQFRGARGGAAGNGTFGAIIAKDEKSITVKDQAGSTRIVLLAESSQINKTATGTVADLSIGTNVMVTGEANQDGSLTAQFVQIRPAGGQGFAPRATQ